MIKYRAFVKIVEMGSLTKAAKALGYSQPGISHIINTLEAEIGFPLLKRSKDAMIPTEDGRRLLEYCRRIIAHEDAFRETAKQISGISAGTIRIGAVNSMMVSFIPRIVRRFSEEYPKVKLFIEEYPTPQVGEALKEGIIDIAFTPDQHIKNHEFIHLFSDPICLIAHESHPFAAYDKIPVSYLNGCDFIMPKREWSDLPAVIEKHLSLSPFIRHHISSEIVGISMVAENLGVYIIPKLQENLVPAHVVVKEFEEDIVRHMGFSVRSLKHAMPALQALIETTWQMVDEEWS